MNAVAIRHDCSTPEATAEMEAAAKEAHGATGARWKCPACGSTWDFIEHYMGGRFFFMWRCRSRVLMTPLRPVKARWWHRKTRTPSEDPHDG